MICVLLSLFAVAAFVLCVPAIREDLLLGLICLKEPHRLPIPVELLTLNALYRKFSDLDKLQSLLNQSTEKGYIGSLFLLRRDLQNFSASECSVRCAAAFLRSVLFSDLGARTSNSGCLVSIANSLERMSDRWVVKLTIVRCKFLRGESFILGEIFHGLDGIGKNLVKGKNGIHLHFKNDEPIDWCFDWTRNSSELDRFWIYLTFLF